MSRLPGGEFMFQKETILSSLAKELNLSFPVEKFCNDEDFANAFTQAIPDKEEQKKYLINTSKYTQRVEHDPNYVLFFRRTLPSADPKPEEYWTEDYVQVSRGLPWELPHGGPHRLHSIILCDSLKHLLSNGNKEKGLGGATDGEILVNFPNYDQNTSVLKFKPRHEQKALEEYLKTDGAVGQQQILQALKEKHSK